jgi:hypothetical protein
MTLNSGKLAVLGIVLLAVGLAGFAWWWNWQRTARCREFYGGEGAHLIRAADHVEGLELSSLFVREAREQILVGSEPFDVVSRKDLSRAPGLVHARTALLDDASYDWEDQTTGDCHSRILYAVEFRDGSRRTTLAFDFGCRRVWIVEAHGSRKRATLAPKIASGWESFLTRQLNQEPAAAGGK